MVTKEKIRMPILLYPLITPKRRGEVWANARGIWKGRKPDPIKELAKMRKEWERKLPKRKPAS
jgi:hypothetical protein